MRRASVDVDLKRIHESLLITEVGNKYVVAREVFLSNDFVSLGRVLVPKTYWESYAGIWVPDDCGTFPQEEYQIRILPDGGGLACTATGVHALVDDFVETAFQGQGKRLFDEPQDGELAFGVHEGESRKGGLVWKSSKDGKAEVHVRTSDGTLKWVPAEVRFKGYEQLSIFHDGLKVATFHRQVPKDLSLRTFDGNDWVFGEIEGNNIGEVHWSEVLASKGSAPASLHYAAVQEENCMLRMLMSHGHGGRGRPCCVQFPIPPAKLAETMRYVEKWQDRKSILFWRGSAYYGTSVMRLARSETTTMMDHTLRVYCAVILASTFMAMSSMDASMAAGAYGGGDAGEAGGDGGGMFGFGGLSSV